MDFVQALDPSKLVLAGTAVSFFLSIFASPSYNLPMFLFGCYAQENAEALQSLQTFTGLLGVSMIFDIIWMVKNQQPGFAVFLNICLLILKLPTFFAFANSLRQRGSQFGGLGSSIGGPTVWSMPGGFTSGGREGYQTVDDEPFIRNVRPTAPSPHMPPMTAHVEPTPPGAYQSVV
ncbi:hypothetical protein BYT27DRAFT_7232939 [Phlegmacium glaucopus]|nr:hypothetical protein BYT27DRAFT_7232939 [Phlegmacium glaucopus]